LPQRVFNWKVGMPYKMFWKWIPWQFILSTL